jgi:hypothetical protein
VSDVGFGRIRFLSTFWKKVLNPLHRNRVMRPM